MIRLNITAEGFSEERFVKDILCPHLLDFGIYADVRKVLTNRKLRKRGGMVSYAKLENDLRQWIKECPDVYHTTLIDLYGLHNDFPGYEASKHLKPYSKVAKVEEELGRKINFYKFIPYIQLHEYEALLFSAPEEMEKWLSLYTSIPINSFQGIRNRYNTPEEINDSADTAPSKRIQAICPDYDKVDDGILLIKEIGLATIRKECPHFNEWLTKLEGLNKNND